MKVNDMVKEHSQQLIANLAIVLVIGHGKGFPEFRVNIEINLSVFSMFSISEDK